MSDPVTRADFEQFGRAVEAMTSTVAEGIAAQTEAVRDMAKAMDARNVESARATGGRVEMHFNAGSVALWVSATCAAMALVVAGFLGLVVFWFAIKTNDQGHQMNAMYQSVPGLRELVARQMTLIDQTSQPPKEEKAP